MNAGRICSLVVVTASPQATIRSTARRMAEQDVGTLVVLDGTAGGKPIGIVTDRDVVVRCMARNLDPDLERVGIIMTAPVQVIEEHAPVEEAMARMARTGTRRLVVTSAAGGMVGVLSLDDVIDLLSREAETIGGLLAKQQIHVPA